MYMVTCPRISHWHLQSTAGFALIFGQGQKHCQLKKHAHTAKCTRYSSSHTNAINKTIVNVILDLWKGNSIVMISAMSDSRYSFHLQSFKKKGSPANSEPAKSVPKGILFNFGYHMMTDDLKTLIIKKIIYTVFLCSHN